MTRLITIACVLLAIGSFAYADQTLSGNTTLSVTVPVEATFVVDGATSMTTTGTNFTVPYSGVTNFTYKIRTKSGGNITAQVTSDFTPATGPSVKNAAEPLTYTCQDGASGATPCSGLQTASMTGTTSVDQFPANFSSVKAGNSGTVTWSLPDDPAYTYGSYSATIVFTLSAQ